MGACYHHQRTGDSGYYEHRRLIAIIVSKEHAEAITRYAEAWQTFFITGIVGYDAKSAIENVLKISKSVKELQAEKNSADDPGNG